MQNLIGKSTTNGETVLDVVPFYVHLSVSGWVCTEAADCPHIIL